MGMLVILYLVLHCISVQDFSGSSQQIKNACFIIHAKKRLGFTVIN